MVMTTRAVFRFDALAHEYIDMATGELYPHITGMLEATGWVDDRFYTEESSDRGVAVHRLTADYDLAALDVDTCTSRFRGYLLAHVRAMHIYKPTMLAVEEPLVHPTLRYGGRPDRDAIILHRRGVWEVKSGAEQRPTAERPVTAHQVQTALQAILVAVEARLPPESLARYCCYVKDKGRFRVIEHKDRRDFDEARRVIRECTNELR